MFGSAKKVPTTCPHCGSVQLEPRGLISTFCRACGDHFTVAAPAAAPLAPVKPLASRLREKLHVQRRRRFRCHECGHPQHVPVHTRFTQCAACGADVHLGDIEVTGHCTRVVETCGTVHVGRDGYLNSPRVDCGGAFIEGRISGRVTCEGTLRLRGEGICRAQIRTRRLLIDRGANLRLTFTVIADEVLVRGILEADIHCGGALHVSRHGELEGDIQARAMAVDKGGHYAGAVQILPTISHPAPIARPEREPVRVIPGWRGRLAFG